MKKIVLTAIALACIASANAGRIADPKSLDGRECKVVKNIATVENNSESAQGEIRVCEPLASPKISMNPTKEKRWFKGNGVNKGDAYNSNTDVLEDGDELVWLIEVKNTSATATISKVVVNDSFPLDTLQGVYEVKGAMTAVTGVNMDQNPIKYDAVERGKVKAYMDNLAPNETRTVVLRVKKEPRAAGTQPTAPAK
jgi:hypothetical protein